MRFVLVCSVFVGFVACGPPPDTADGGPVGGGMSGGEARAGGSSGGGAACSGALRLCGGVCRDVQTDPGFCGSCTNFCSGGDSCVGGQCRAASGGGTAGGASGGLAGGGTAGGVTAGGAAGGVTAGGSAGGTAGGVTAGGSAGGTAGGVTAGGSAGGTAGGVTAGGSAGGTAGGVTAGGSAGGTAGGSTAGGVAGGIAGGGSAGGSTAGGVAGGSSAGGTAGGTAAVCGNGIVQSGEACDDGNLITTDGCVGCAISPGYVCSGQPSLCSTTTFRINNGTSFPLVSAVIDGVERIPARNASNMCFGYAPGTFAEFNVTPNQTHTWRVLNGGVTDDTTCNDLQHESWGPTTFNQPAGLTMVTLSNRALEAYVNTDSGFSYSCWQATYTDGVNTRIARLRLNNGGTWSFREFYNLNPAMTIRSFTGTSWPEQTRTIGFSFTYRLVSGTAFWNAQWDRSGGHSIQNGVNALTGTLLNPVLYLRQPANGGTPTNCP
ncbi:MAG: hypothetical protein Q8S33_01465 [Myxococcales bacterium]|nr:hypothetical protein [Myxococcales bacterium]